MSMTIATTAGSLLDLLGHRRKTYTKRPAIVRRAPRLLRARTGGTALLAAALAGCGGGPDADAIIQRAIEAHGVQVLDTARVSFDFRGERYISTRDNGRFRLERIYQEDGSRVREILTNDGTYREVDGVPQPLTDDERESVATAVNSVLYFAFLPHKLDDPGVVARYLGEDRLAGRPYDRVEVTFDPEEGGRDWEDRFLYWFHPEEGTLDYMAYRYHVGQGGTRFRQAVNRRWVEGIVVQDYENLTRQGTEDIEEYGPAYEELDLEWVSYISIGNVSIESLPEDFPDDPEAPQAPESAG